MNCIFCCVFNQNQFNEVFFSFIESIFIYGNLTNETEILIYTSTFFMNKIKQSHLFNNAPIKFEINDNYNELSNSYKAKLDLFQLPSISNYKKILYLDTNIIIKDFINKVFDFCKEDILYTLEEGSIDSNTNVWGKSLFGDEINKYNDKSAFTNGILLFNNCETIKELFNNINQDIIDRPNLSSYWDQPYIVYNAFKYNLYNNKILKNLAVNNDENIRSFKIIHQFSADPGSFKPKIESMKKFLFYLKEATILNHLQDAKNYIDQYLLPIIKQSKEPLEGNIFMYHLQTKYTDAFINKRKNISNLVLNKNIKKVMEIGFNSGFSTLLMLLSNPFIKIKCFDLGAHSYTLPCYNQLKSFFGDRLNLCLGDSTKTLPNESNGDYDLIHIDGGHSHDVANSDIYYSYRLSKSRTILILDDYDSPVLHKLWDNYINLYNLKKLDSHTYDTNTHDIKFIVNK